VEVKSPYRAYGSEIVADKSKMHFLAAHCDNQQLHLKESSKYFMQVKGQCDVTGRKFCYIVVHVYICFNILLS